jgi:protein-disulfide isomerase
VDTGKVRFLSKDYPMNVLSDRALIAAEASYCAADQGKY